MNEIEPFVCPAEIHSDDRIYEVPFDAERFFLVAHDDDIRALIECEWRGDYGADEVALYCRDENELVDDALNYVERCRKTMGFEVSVDADQALKVLWEVRPSLMREIDSEGNYDVTKPLGEENADVQDRP